MKGISVILPVYNGADLLKGCIESVSRAGTRVHEIIIVDDGSIDRTLAIAQELAKSDERIRVIHTDNHGSYTARNTGIKVAVSPYLAFIDVDDRFTPGALDFLANLLEKTGADIAIGGYRRVDSLEECAPPVCNDAADKYVSTPFDDEWVVHTIDEVWPRLMKWKTQEFLWYLWNKLYRKELFQNLEESEGLCQGDDVLLSAQVFLNTNTVVETKNTVYLYYQNPNSMLHSQFGDRDLDLICVWDKVVELTEENNAPLVDGKSLHELALFNRWRTDFTLIMRLILAGDRMLDQKYVGQLQKWRAGLRSHWKDLISPHAMPKNREILIIALRFFYSPVKELLRFGHVFRK